MTTELTSQVSLDSRVREIINKNMMNPSKETFAEAQLQIYTLMHRDSYPRFVNSPNFKELLEQQSPGQESSWFTIITSTIFTGSREFIPSSQAIFFSLWNFISHVSHGHQCLSQCITGYVSQSLEDVSNTHHPHPLFITSILSLDVRQASLPHHVKSEDKGSEQQIIGKSSSIHHTGNQMKQNDKRISTHENGREQILQVFLSSSIDGPFKYFCPSKDICPSVSSFLTTRNSSKSSDIFHFSFRTKSTWKRDALLVPEFSGTSKEKQRPEAKGSRKHRFRCFGYGNKKQDDTCLSSLALNTKT